MEMLEIIRGSCKYGRYNKHSLGFMYNSKTNLIVRITTIKLINLNSEFGNISFNLEETFFLNYL